MTAIERTHRWRVAFTFVLFTISAGLYIEQPLILLSSMFGIAYVGYSLLVPQPTVNLELSRTVSNETPNHGESVTVTVTVANTGSAALVDLRLIDGVPPLLTVTNGTPRHTATLRPGSSTTFQYTVIAKHGKHQFERATAVVHNISGSVRIQTEVSADTQTDVDTELVCSVDLHGIQLRRQTHQVPGRSASDASGSGIEFHRTRTYQRGDQMNRIDWKRFARTGDLTAIEFQEEHRTAVILCLDARTRAIRASQSNEPHAVAYSVAAAMETLSELLERGERVGVAVFASEFSWLPPDTGRQHRSQAMHLLRTHQLTSMPDEDVPEETCETSAQLQQFLVRSSGNGEVILFSPLVDEFGVSAAQRWNGNGRSVTVISPDVSSERTLGAEFAKTERANRVHLLQNSQIPVSDWVPGEPLIWPVERGKRRPYES